MNLFNLLFGFQGRIGRAQFWLVVLIQVVFFFAVVGSLMVAFPASLDTVFDPTIVAYVPLVVSAVAIGIKRLHDRNKSAWWLTLFCGAPLLITALEHFGLDNESPRFFLALLCVGVAIMIWALVELGCLRGSIGANQYGGDPLAPQHAQPRTLR